MVNGTRGILAQAQGSTRPSIELLSDGQSWLSISSYGNWSSAVVFSDNLVGWWNFSDGIDDTTLEDLSINDNHGSLKGGMSLSGSAVAGNLGGGLDFDGVDDGVTIDQFPIQNGEPVTVSCWAKYVYKGSSATQSLVMYRKSGHGRFSLSFFRHDYLYLDDFSGTNYKFLRVQPGDLRNKKDWIHLVFSFDSKGGRRFWIDGVEKPATNRGGETGNSEGHFTIGYRNGRSDRYKEGPIEDLKLFSRTMEHDEVMQLYEAGRFR